MSAFWAFLVLAAGVAYFIQQGRRDTDDARRWFQEEKREEYMVALERHARGELSDEDLAKAREKYGR